MKDSKVKIFLGTPKYCCQGRDAGSWADSKDHLLEFILHFADISNQVVHVNMQFKSVVRSNETMNVIEIED